MKNSINIVNHLLNKPSYSKINQLKCFDRLKEMLPLHLKNAVVFIYQKDKTLFFVLNHPGIKMEFNYKLQLIKLWLKQLKKLEKNCSMLDIETIKAFVTNRVSKNSDDIEVVRYFKERSDGGFENRAVDEDIKALFEEIRSVIKDEKTK